LLILLTVRIEVEILSQNLYHHHVWHPFCTIQDRSLGGIDPNNAMMLAPGSHPFRQRGWQDDRNVNLSRQVLIDKSQFSSKCAQTGWFWDNDQAVRYILQGAKELGLIPKVV
jgi:hypothetical protein